MLKLPSSLFCCGMLSLGILGPAANAQEHAHSADGNKPWSMADEYFDPDEMAHARAHVLQHHGAQSTGMLMVDKMEYQASDDEELAAWDASFWYGNDENRLYLTSEGEYSFDHQEFEEAEIQALWSKPISTYFDLQAGLKYDIEPHGEAHAVFGFQGLAPYWFEVDGAAYLSEEGDLTADFEVEYELFITQRLILQPIVELGWSAQDNLESGNAAGLNEIEAGLRLRYEAKREFAPYIGVEHKALLGKTADWADALGDETEHTVFVVGIRSWY